MSTHNGKRAISSNKYRYNVTVGGGMGMTHGNKKTFPRLADVIGFCEKSQAIDVGEKVHKAFSVFIFPS